MRRLTAPLIGVALLMGIGLVATPAKAVPPVPKVMPQTLVDEARWRPRLTVRRPVRRPVRRTLRGVGRAAAGVGRAARNVGRVARRLGRIF
jgi:hypothetical protein